MNILLGAPFYIFFINFSLCKARLPKHLIVTNTAAPSNVNHTFDSNYQNVLVIGISEVGKTRPMNFTSMDNAIQNISLQCTTSLQKTENRKYRPIPLYKMKNQNTFAQDWREEDHISKKYAACYDEFIDKLTKLQSIWNSHLGRISMAMHRIELLDESTRPENSTSYRAGPETREFEKIEIGKMLFQKIIEPSQS